MEPVAQQLEVSKVALSRVPAELFLAPRQSARMHPKSAAQPPEMRLAANGGTNALACC
jgi:hypothetical protein